MQGNGSAGTAASAGQVREQILIVLQAWGMAPDLAAITAGLMAETDLLGIDSHGISMLPSYEESCARARSGSTRGRAWCATAAPAHCWTAWAAWATRCRRRP